MLDFDNGPRKSSTTGRNRNSMANIASKQESPVVRSRPPVMPGPKATSAPVSYKTTDEVKDALANLKKLKEDKSKLLQTQELQLPKPAEFKQPTSLYQANTDKLQSLMQLALMVGKQNRRHAGGGSVPGNVKQQLMQGFVAAGRPDLAKMVRTKAFDLWVSQESGWDPRAVSPANNQGQRNGGLFQFWYGHDFSNKAEGAHKFKASPFQQALWAAQNFNLTPERIRQFAQQIKAGTYGGWG